MYQDYAATFTGVGNQQASQLHKIIQFISPGMFYTSKFGPNSRIKVQNVCFVRMIMSLKEQRICSGAMKTGFIDVV